MSTRRMIDPAIWQSETIASLNYCQRLLFIGLFSNADDQGRLRGNPALIRSTIFPYDDIPSENIARDLAAIEQVGSIIVYEADGKEFIQITGWWEYQSPQWAYPSKYPAPPGWKDKLRYRENNTVLTHNWNGKGGNETPGRTPEAPNPPAPPSQPLPESLPESLPEPLPEPLPGSIVLVLELESELESELEIKEGESLGVAGTREKPPPLPQFVPAYKIWVDNGLSSGIHQLDIACLDEVVGRSPPDLELFGKICAAWRSLGWKKTNVSGVLDYFSRGELPGRKGRENGYKRTHESDTSNPDRPPPGIDLDTWRRLNAKPA